MVFSQTTLQRGAPIESCRMQLLKCSHARLAELWVPNKGLRSHAMSCSDGSRDRQFPKTQCADDAGNMTWVRPSFLIACALLMVVVVCCGLACMALYVCMYVCLRVWEPGGIAWQLVWRSQGTVCR